MDGLFRPQGLISVPRRALEHLFFVELQSFNLGNVPLWLSFEF